MFKKKQIVPKTHKYYVLAYYRDGLKFRSRLFNTEQQARVMRDSILTDAEAQEWVEIDGDIVRSNYLEALTIERTA